MVKRFSAFLIFSLVLLFALCQVVGVLCPPPQVPFLHAVTLASDDPMTCPMPVGLICQPQLTSSQSREGDQQKAQQFDQPIVHVDLAPAPVYGSPSTVFSPVLPSLMTQAVSLQVLRI